MQWKPLSILLALPVILSLSGCFMQSLYPCYSEQTVVDAPELVGEWRDADDQEQNTPAWQFQEDGTIITVDEGVTSAVSAVYFRVGEHLFTDWTAGEIDDDASINLYWRLHVMPTHSVLKVDHRGDSLSLTPLDLEWITETAQADPSVLPYLLAEDEDRILFVAFPEEWEAFLLEHATNAAAFKPDSALEFIRVPVEDPAQPATAAVEMELPPTP